MHVVLLGRASNPDVCVGGVGGSGVGGTGGGGVGDDGGGGSCTPWPSRSLPPPQPAIRNAKDNNIPVACLARGMGASSYFFSVARDSVQLRLIYEVRSRTRGFEVSTVRSDGVVSLRRRQP
jgi:hypothetical protein